jgi:hypothetical protein
MKKFHQFFFATIAYRATLKDSIILGPFYLGVWNRALNFAW